jgi:hypothetical protein
MNDYLTLIMRILLVLYFNACIVCNVESGIIRKIKLFVKMSKIHRILMKTSDID